MSRRGVVLFWVTACAVLFIGQVPFAVVVGAQAPGVRSARLEPAYESASLVPGLPSEVFSDPVVRSDPPEELEMSPVVVPDPEATVGEELVERRSSHSRIYARSDGLVEVRVSPEPVAYESDDGNFELIDTTVRESGDGGLVADRNSFVVRFGGSDSGVELELPSGRVITSVPVGLDGVEPDGVVVPEVDEADPSLVWYRDVWPGVDLRYRVGVSGLSEDVVFQRRPDGAGAVRFVVSGAELDSVWREPASGAEAALNDGSVVPPDPRVTPATSLGLAAAAEDRGGDAGVELSRGVRTLAEAERPSEAARASLAPRGSLGGEVSFGPVVALSGADEMPVLDPAASPLVRSKVSGEDESVVEVSVDPDWLASQPDEAFPVVLDPDVLVGAYGHRAYLNVLGTECGSGGPSCWLRAGYPAISGYPFSVWRTAFGVDMSTAAGDYGLTGSGADKVFTAALVFNREGGYSGSSTLKLHAPTAWSWSGAVGGGQLGSTTGTSQFYFDRTTQVKSALAASTTGLAWGISADPVGSYNFKDLGVGLVLTVNDAPPAPPIAASSAPSGEQFFAGTIDAVPTLAVDAVSDTTFAPGQSSVQYHFSVASNAIDTTEGTGDIATWSGTSTTLPSGQITAAELEDGHTYYWRVWADDGFQATPSQLFSFTFDRRLGTGGPSPMVGLSPLTVNAATGNMVFGWSSRQVTTLGGGAGVSLSYNSLLNSGAALLEATPGLPPGWRGSWGELPVTSLEFTDGGSAVIRMTDGGRESFRWNDSDERWEPVEDNNYSLFTEVGSGYQWQTTGGWTVEFDRVGGSRSAGQPNTDRCHRCRCCT